MIVDSRYVRQPGALRRLAAALLCLHLLFVFQVSAYPHPEPGERAVASAFEHAGDAQEAPAGGAPEVALSRSVGCSGPMGVESTPSLSADHLCGLCWVLVTAPGTPPSGELHLSGPVLDGVWPSPVLPAHALIHRLPRIRAPPHSTV